MTVTPCRYDFYCNVTVLLEFSFVYVTVCILNCGTKSVVGLVDIAILLVEIFLSEKSYLFFSTY